MSEDVAEIYAFTFMIGFHLLTVAITYPEYRRTGHRFIRTTGLAIIAITGWHFINAFLATGETISFSGYVLGNLVLLAGTLLILVACAQFSGTTLPTPAVPLLVGIFLVTSLLHYIIGTDLTVRLLSLAAILCLLLSIGVLIQQQSAPLWQLMALVISLLVVAFSITFLILLYVDPEQARFAYFMTSFLFPAIGLLMFQSSLTTTTLEAKQSAQAFREMFESVQEVFLRIDQQGSVLDVSPSVAQFGYTRQALLGQSLSMIYAVPTKFHQDLSRLIGGKRIPHLPLKLKTAQGETRDCEMSLNSVQDLTGKIQTFVGTVRDVDDRNQFERQFLDAQRRESMGMLAGGIAHDFNNILQGIVGHADWMLHKPDMTNSAREEHLRIILEASNTAASLCRQLLEYTGRSYTQMEPVMLNEAVKDVLDISRHSIPEGVIIRNTRDFEPLVVDADATQLRQVVMNLIQNAVEAIAGEGEIQISVHAVYFSQNDLDDIRPAEQALTADRYAIVEVGDTGCGMNESAVARMFDPFYSTKSMGHGLGLAAVIGIIRSHAGGILVNSRPQSGTTVRLLLPLASDQQARPTIGSSTVRSGDRQLILIADDEPDIRDVVTSVLEQNGYDVISAGDGVEAVGQFDRHRDRIAAIIMDIKMPIKDGLAAVAEIREKGSSVPILVASGFSESTSEAFSSAALRYRFIAKPYRRETLLNALNAAIK